MTTCRDQTTLRVAAFAEQHRLFEPAGQVAVGFSGGADSTALLLILRHLGVPLVAVHLHHGMRGPSADADAEWCARFCREQGFAFQRHDLNVPQQRLPRESLEEAGRRCRLEFWQAHFPRPDRIALGHHADDCLEDLILRLARGANVSGLTGLRPLRRIGRATLIRPLLGLRRTEIEDVLRHAGIADWRRDPTNDDRRFLRNRVRHEVLPRLVDTFGHDRGLLRALDALRSDADFIEGAAQDAKRRLDDRESWNALHPALLPRVFRLWLTEQLGEDVVPTRQAVERLTEALQNQRSESVQIPLRKGVTVTVTPRGLRLDCTDAPAKIRTRTWHWDRDADLRIPEAPGVLRAERLSAAPAPVTGRHTELFDESALSSPLTVRTWQPGDAMIPFGANSPKKLQDIFTDDKVPRHRRNSTPVVISRNTIVWVAGVRRAECGRAAAGQPAVRLTWIPEST